MKKYMKYIAALFIVVTIIVTGMRLDKKEAAHINNKKITFSIKEQDVLVVSKILNMTKEESLTFLEEVGITDILTEKERENGYITFSNGDDLNKKLCIVEFSEFKKEDYKDKSEEIYRVHSIQDREVSVYDDYTLYKRYKRAVIERGNNILVFKFFKEGTKDELEKGLELVSKIKGSLEDEGYKVTSNTSNFDIEPLSLSLVYMILITFLIVFDKFLTTIIKINKKYSFTISISMIVSFILIGIYSDIILKQMVALFIAAIMPAISIIYFMEKSKIKSIYLKFLAISIVNILFGFFVHALISDNIFVIGIEVFKGVKVAFILPILIVFMYYIFINKIKFKLDMKFVLINVAILFIIIIVIKRTGNYNNVFDFEIYLRNFLDDIFKVRPRTKELIGYPAIMLLFKYGKNYIYLLLAIIGQVSLINTFAHTQTTLNISLARTFIAVAISIIVIFITTNIYEIVKRKVSK